MYAIYIEYFRANGSPRRSFYQISDGIDVGTEAECRHIMTGLRGSSYQTIQLVEVVPVVKNIKRTTPVSKSRTKKE